MRTEPWQIRPMPVLPEPVMIYRVVRCNRRHPLLELLTGVGHTHTVLYIGPVDDPKVAALIESEPGRTFGERVGWTLRPQVEAAVLATCAHTPPQQLPATCN